MKLSVLIDANASALKTEAAAAKAAIEKIGVTASASAAGVAKMDAALEETAASSREASAAIGALTTAEAQLDAASTRAAAGVVKIEIALEETSAASREASQAIAALVGSQGQLLSTSQQLVAALNQSSQGASSFEAAARAMVTSTANLDAALKKTSDAHERFIELMKPKPANDNPFEAPAKSADELRAKYDPLFAIGLRYRQQVEEIRKGHADGSISAAAMATMIERVGVAADASHSALLKSQGGVVEIGGAAKLTGMQMQGLGYQVNDVATMLAMGASPFQVMASQAGQVIQVLGEGPGGIRGSLVALKDGAVSAGAAVLRFLTPWGVGIAAVSAAALGLAYVFRDKVQPIGELVDQQAEQIKALRDAYGIAASGAEDYGRRSRAAVEADAAQTQRATVRSQAVSAQDVLAQLAPYDGSGLAKRVAPAFADLKRASDAFRASVEANAPNFTQLENDLAEIAKTSADEKVLEFVDALRQSIRINAEAQGGLRSTELLLKGVGEAAAIAAAKASKAYDAFRGLVPENLEPEADRLKKAFADLQSTTYGPLNPKDVERYNEARRAMSRQSLEDLIEIEGRRQDITKSSTDAQIAEINRRYEREALAAKLRTNDDPDAENRRKARDEEIALVRDQAKRAEDQRRTSYDLDVRAISARTAAQRAGIDAERAQAEAIAAGAGPAEAARRAEEARTLTMGRAREQVAEAGRQQEEASRRQVEQAQLEYDLIGQSAGRAAELRTQFDLLAQAKDAARAAGFDESTVTLTDAMREQAAEVGRLTEATQRLNFERDLMFERQQAGRSPEEQRIAADLRQVGVEYDSVQGQADAAQLRLNNRLHETNDLFWEMRDRVGTVFGDMIAALGRGESAFDAITKVAANFFSQFATAGADRFSKWLMGGTGSGGSGASTGSSGGLGAILGKVAETAAAAVVRSGDGGVPIPTARPTYYAPSYPYADKYALPDMTAATRKMTNANSSLVEVLEDGAKRIGTTARDLGAVISFETGGTFSTSIRGGANNQHIGLIQFGAAEQKRYGAAIGQTLSDQMDAVVGYMKDRGFKPGMSLLDLYSTVNAGSPGRHNASDAANGGTWGTVADKVNSQFASHLAKADSILGGTNRDFQRSVERGTTSGVREGIDQIRPASTSSDTAGQPRQLTGGQQAFMGLAGLVGAFSGGYQSGSPLGGGLQGAMGGFELGSSLSFLGAAGGPIGAAVGGIVGLIGGIFGKRKQKKAEQEQARREWEAMQPQHEAFRKYLSGEESGALRTDFMQIQAQFDQFNAASTKAGKGDLVETARIFYDYVTRQLTGFREGFEGISKDLADGAGLNGPFASGKASIRQLQKELLGFLDDVKIAYGSADNGLRKGPGSAQAEADWAKAREEAFATAQRSAQEAALSILNPPKELSTIEENYRGAMGAAQQLLVTLPKLGMSAADATRRVGEELARYVATLRGEVELGVSDRILELTDKSYLIDARQWLEEFATLQSQAALTGADTSNFGELFRLEAQEIVDGAELTGDAFAELVKLFPQFAGVVTQFAKASAQTTEQLREQVQQFATGRYQTALRERIEAENELRSAYERSVDRIADMRDYLTGMRLDPDSSTLNGEERFREAERVFNETLTRRDAGDEDAAEKLLDVTEDYRSAAKDFYQTSAGYGAVQERIETILGGTATKIQSELDLARAQVSSLGEIAGNTKGLSALLQAALSARGAAEREVGKVDETRSWGVNPERNRKNVAEFRAAGLPEYTGNFGPDTWPQIQAWLDTLTLSQQDRAMAIMRANNAINRATGGPVWGPGTATSDSIPVNLSNGEVVTRTWAAERVGYSTMEHINRTGTLPMPRRVVMPAAAAAAEGLPGAFGGSRADREVLDRLDTLTDVLRGGFRSSIEATSRIGGDGALAAAAARREGARSVTRWAA